MSADTEESTNVRRAWFWRNWDFAAAGTRSVNSWISFFGKLLCESKQDIFSSGVYDRNWQSSMRTVLYGILWECILSYSSVRISWICVVPGVLHCWRCDGWCSPWYCPLLILLSEWSEWSLWGLAAMEMHLFISSNLLAVLSSALSAWPLNHDKYHTLQTHWTHALELHT